MRELTKEQASKYQQWLANGTDKHSSVGNELRDDMGAPERTDVDNPEM
ncbi:MAG: hypothetical protein U5J63_08950 [Fodinibius sp.]|nr:hypothetical protein [Fodinibius sp.]